MKKPFYISKETWDNLKDKEKDFIYYLREKKYTKKEIMKKLYINTRQGYWKLQKRVSEKIKNDVNKVYNVNY
jgi:DNA invertase Pin-like site-specific DNA recombinase